MKAMQSLITDLKKFDKRMLVIVVVSGVCLAGINYFSSAYRFSEHRWFFENVGLLDFYNWLYHYLYEDEHSSLWRLVFWASATVFFYFLIPALTIKFIFKEKLRYYGLKRKNAFGYFSLYALLFACIFPVVFMVSYSPQFQSTYPFYSPQNPSELFPYFFVWECFYVLQFFALEFFFRGFMVHGLKREMGMYAVAAMVVPYCMIHFTKPLPECIGSIFAGIILGVLSYRTGSVWLGALIHVAVALSMDWLSLWQKGIFV